MDTIEVIVLIICIVFWIICGFLTKSLHSYKGYSGGFWIGFLFGPLGLLYSVGLPDLILRNCVAKNASASAAPSGAIAGEPEKQAPLQEPEQTAMPIVLHDNNNQVIGFQVRDTVFSVNDRVRHPTMGEGIITQITETDFTLLLNSGLTIHPDIKGNTKLSLYQKVNDRT